MKKTSRGKRRVLAALAAAALAAAAVRFAVWRSADRDAWPSALAEISPAPVAPENGTALGGDAAAALAAALPPPEGAPLGAYRVFQTEGIGALAQDDLAAVRARAADPSWAALGEALSRAAGFEPGADGPSPGTAAVVARSSETAVLEAFAAQDAEADAPAARLGNAAARALRVFTRGGGVPAYSAGLAAAALFSREASMAACDLSRDPFGSGGAAEAVAAFREAERAIGPLGAAVRDDWRAARAAVSSVFGQMEGRTAPAPGAKGPGRTTAWMVGKLGGTEAGALAHVDALFSRLAANADAPFSKDGLVAGLPAWCREGSRPPWTRDPVASSVAQGYLRHARYAAALPAAAALELRAARVALALRAWRDAAGDWPDALGVLESGDAALGVPPLLGAGDSADPFAPDGSALRYARDADGWRLWSVGTDQSDGGGAVDAFTAGKNAAGKPADFVFTSRERDIRKAASDAGRKGKNGG